MMEMYSAEYPEQLQCISRKDPLIKEADQDDSCKHLLQNVCEDAAFVNPVHIPLDTDMPSALLYDRSCGAFFYDLPFLVGILQNARYNESSDN